MTRKRRRLTALALMAAIGVIGAWGSAALAGNGHGSSAGEPNAVNHKKAVAATVSTAVAPAASLPARSTASP
jgi:hypothetical protein